MNGSPNRLHVQIPVNCNIPGLRYFTRDGVIIFEKCKGPDCEPQSYSRLLV